MDIIVTTAFGTEGVTARELRDLGYEDITVDNGKIIFKGDASDVVRANMWLRTAARVLIRVGEFKATTFEELFEGVKALPWEEWIPEDGRFPVSGKSVQSTLFSISDCQAITKKAIVEKLKQKYQHLSKLQVKLLIQLQIHLQKNFHHLQHIAHFHLY